MYVHFYCFDISYSPANIIMELYVSFPIDGFDHWKVVSYQLGYAVQDTVSDYTNSTVISITMVNNKKQYFWLSFILSCGNSKKYFWLACLQTRPKIVCWLSVYAATLPPSKPVFCFEKVSQLQESAWTAILSLM